MSSPYAVRIVLYRLISLVVLSCYLAGCSFFGPSMQSIGVSSDPPEAQVLVSGKPVGQTPVHFEVHRGENLLVEVRKSGYQTQYRTAFRTLSTLGTLDIVGGCIILFPFLGLLSSGAWTHDPSEYGFILEPQRDTSQTR